MAAIRQDHPEVKFAKENNIKVSKRDEFINQILEDKRLELIAVSGTHGKTNTTGMLIWLFKSLSIPISYSIGTNLTFGPNGAYDPNSRYFIYEADEFDRNMTKFHPKISIITTLDFDHPDTYDSVEDYIDAFRKFVKQSSKTYSWPNVSKKLDQDIEPINPLLVPLIRLIGKHTRENAALAISAVAEILEKEPKELIDIINEFPGTERRMEKLKDNIYTDYAHHPAEIAATIDAAEEINSDIVVVYQPHQNLRQKQVISQYKDAFLGAMKMYWLPTYLSREPETDIVPPEELVNSLSNKEIAEIADMDEELVKNIKEQASKGHLVILMSAGDLDPWARANI